MNSVFSMPQVRLHLDPIWSLPIVIVVTLLAIATVWTGYQFSRGLSSNRRMTLAAVRMLTVIVLLVGMLRPQIQWIAAEGDKANIWVLTDQSRSMSVPDGPGGVTRRVALQQTLESVDDELRALSKEVSITLQDFASTPELIEEVDETADGQQTAIGSVLGEAVKRTGQTPLTSIFLLTDGAQRAVPPYDEDPRLPARELGELGVSLYPVPIGKASSIDAAADVAVEEIQVDPVVFVKKRVPVQVALRWAGAGGQQLRVRLFIEDRAGLKPGESGKMVPIPPSEFSRTDVTIDTRMPTGSEMVELSFTPELAGEYKISAVVEPVTGEVQTRNNSRATLVTVRQGGLRVAYFDIFRTEVKSIRQLNASEKVQIDFQMMRSGAFAQDTSVDDRWFEPGRYDVFIIGDVAAEQFGEKNLQALAARVREGAGLLMLGGYHTYGAGGYAETPLETFIPVAMRPEEEQPAGVFSDQLQIRDEIQLQPSTAGNRHYVTRIDTPGRNEQAWLDLPPLLGASRIQAKSNFVEVLATSTTGDHLIVAAETGRSRVMCFAFDQTYLWSQAGFETLHRRFWRQSVLWLAHKELETDQPIWVRVTPKAVDPGARVTLEYGARTEEGVPRKDAILQATITGPDGTRKTLTGTEIEEGLFAEFDETVVPGDYFVEVAEVNNQGQTSLPTTARFLVHDRDLELDHPIVDRVLLDEIATLAGLSTDSQVIPPENLEEFLKDFLKRKPWKNDAEVTSSLSLWDGWPILLIFASLMTAEWVLRKKSGLV